MPPVLASPPPAFSTALPPPPPLTASPVFAPPLVSPVSASFSGASHLSSSSFSSASRLRSSSSPIFAATYILGEGIEVETIVTGLTDIWLHFLGHLALP